MILVLNLKMNLTKYSIIEYERLIRDKKVIVLPQYPYLIFFSKGNYSLGSQDVSKFSKGSYTGEVCAKGLKCLGVKYVLVGHSERKQYFNETKKDIKLKLQNVLDNEMIPIFCINQDEEEYKSDEELKHIEEQLECIPDNCKYIIIAFEPTYLIGLKNINIDIENIKKVNKKIKEYLMERGINGSIIYGGGVNEKVLDDLKGISLDGYIISSSALDVKELSRIIDKLKL